MGLTANGTPSIKDKEKTQQLILYIAQKMCEEKGFGATVLNKVLYYIDNYSYLKTGHPISGFTYVKQNHGATPAPGLFMPLKAEMVEGGMIEEIKTLYFARPQKRIIPKVEARVDLFTPEEIDLINEIIDNLRMVNASTISALNHEELAWQFAADKEALPYETYLLTSVSVEEKVLKWAQKVVDDYETVHYR